MKREKIDCESEGGISQLLVSRDRVVSVSLSQVDFPALNLHAKD